ncbi:stage III sporulation protein AG [Scopulibacillus darangshiensis]|uniref:Stage III sporulation protein AG n=1 Tax=Scopulibacillus darangshiensis TaxID=442528 RepID=A0A4R2P880_9BACL|nr:stage III sporulation protein AG [Scopulibacillus darangshiensis]TCP31179.1 stage III sporulation protein AG [Scopulibacillus darangshiensis]
MWNRLIEQLKGLFFTKKEAQPKTSSKSKKSPVQVLALLFALGVALMLLSHFITGQDPKSDKGTAPVFNANGSQKEQLSSLKSDEMNKKFSSIGEYEKYYSRHIEDILDKVTGITNVSAWVTLDSTERNIYQSNEKTQTNRTEETDKNGGKREVKENSNDNEVVVIDDGNNKHPLVAGQRKPEIRGVLVVAEGADSPTIRSWIMEAVSTVLNVPTYKVQVLPRTAKEAP